MKRKRGKAVAKSEVETLSDQIKPAMEKICGNKYSGYAVTVMDWNGTVRTFSTFPQERVADGIQAIADSIRAHDLLNDLAIRPRMVRGAGQP